MSEHNWKDNIIEALKCSQLDLQARLAASEAALKEARAEVACQENALANLRHQIDSALDDRDAAEAQAARAVEVLGKMVQRLDATGQLRWGEVDEARAVLKELAPQSKED